MYKSVGRMILTAMILVSFTIQGLAQQVTPITDVKSLAGTWKGIVRGGTANPGYMAAVSMTVDEDGSYKATGPRGGTVEGKITVAPDGSATYLSSANQGTAVLYGDGTLRFEARTGTVVWERAK